MHSGISRHSRYSRLHAFGFFSSLGFMLVFPLVAPLVWFMFVYQAPKKPDFFVKFSLALVCVHFGSTPHTGHPAMTVNHRANGEFMILQHRCIFIVNPSETLKHVFFFYHYIFPNGREENR